MYYQNTRGLRTKTHEFKRNLSLEEYDIIAVTESWLIDGIGSSELFDERYLVWRRDRDYVRTKEKFGGGVLLATKRTFMATDRPEWASSAEDLWVTLSLQHTNSTPTVCHICTLYLCKESHGNSFNTQLCNFTEKLSILVNSCPNDIFIVLGDFNLSNISWSTQDNYLQPSSISGESQIYFFDTLAECNLNQFNSCLNASNRLLDLVLCNNYYLSVFSCDNPLVPEDPHHKSLEIILKLEKPTSIKPKTRIKFYYESGDYVKINSLLEKVNWDSELTKLPLNNAVDFFYLQLNESIKTYIPKKIITSSTYPSWYNSSLKKVLNEKHKFLKKYRTYGNTSDYHSFTLLRKRAKLLELECYSHYLKTMENGIINNPKLFWKYIKNNKKGSNSLPSTLTYEDQVVDSPDEICNTFSQYFQSIYASVPQVPISNPSSSSIQACDDESPSSSSISDIEITHDFVYKLLSSIDCSKGAGPDLISPLFILKCAQTLAAPLCILFRRSVTEGLVPSIWKSAFITPVFKRGNKSEIKNYRPISKQCLFAKIFEKIIYNQVFSSLSNFFIPEQHGFLKNRSTNSNLVTFTEYITSSMDSGGQVDAVFTDYSKAFDLIDHSILLQKLYSAGIHGNLFRWFTSYVMNRCQAVVIDGYSSRWNTVPSGVPQGSLLGPLLFNIFMNDVGTCFNYCKVLLYADDMKIFKKINDIHDCYLLQLDLDEFDKYCVTNKLHLNISKCQSISFTRKRISHSYDYTLRGLNLNRVYEIKDLGIIHDSKLNYETHIDTITKKAYRALGFVMRACSEFSSLKIIKVLYCSYVRSLLEYCSQVWNPQYKVHINRIESIQRKFVKYLQYKCNVSDTNYLSSCKKHHLLPLEERRRLADINFLVKIAQSLIDSPTLLSKINIRVPYKYTHKRHRPILKSDTRSTNYRQNSFFIRSINSFINYINQSADSSALDLFNSSPNMFRSILSKNWFKTNYS